MEPIAEQLNMALDSSNPACPNVTRAEGPQRRPEDTEDVDPFEGINVLK